jgi:hypothetical protein
MTTAGAGPSYERRGNPQTAIAIGGPCATARIAKLNARNHGWNTGSKPTRIGGRNSRICRIEGVIVAHINAWIGILAHALPVLRATTVEPFPLGL